ncbi:TetR/AcrR family transcriptional regulator [Arthrobacter sp. zg-Y1219]|uniref:TetR/AcrR family transcriptional regulator n=1 Tax=Arthrobacter sp. zg-Y1219 TaxID=3049067 RepID=UPI0024C45BE2|nr:TetR/AcrR family transcriptional regulator [Arthrobacter sp. zg-Y1219]MDK1361092.1 TetR/AcrR family transcriptional regulator [Arthrobacter sp. zg-Y1219]
MPSEAATIDVPQSGGARTDEIRAAAGALFASKGYAATTMNDIAQAVGILPGSLYHHFAAKETIAIELSDAFHAALYKVAVDFRTPEHTALPPEERLRWLVADVSVVGKQHAPALGLRIFEAPTVASKRFSAAVNHRPAALQRVWRSVIADLAPLAPPGVMDQDMLTYALQGLAVSPGVSAGDPRGVDESSRLLCDLLLHGVVLDGPDNASLDASAPMAAVKDVIAHQVQPDAGDETRAQIVTAARREFARRGFDATTIRDIAEAAEVRMGTLYRRIESKQALFAEIVDNYDEQLDALLRVALTTEAESEAESLDALAFGVAYAARRFTDEAHMMSLIWNRQQESQAPVNRYVRHTKERQELLAGLLGQGQDEGRIQRYAAPDILASYVRSVLWSASGRHERTSQRRIQAFLREHLLRGALTPR